MLMHTPISILTLTDEHMKNFAKCPHRFYFQDLLKKDQKLDLHQMIQMTINQIVKEYFNIPYQKRDTLSILKLIDHYWRFINPAKFQSQSQYYMILAKTTNHLLDWLVSENSDVPLLFLYEKKSNYIEELEMNLSVCFEVASWTDKSYIVKKFIYQANNQFLQYFYSLLIVFANKSFQKLPERIEVYCIENGRMYSFSPKDEDLELAMEELLILKGLLSNSANYIKTNNFSECTICPLNQSCQNSESTKLVYV